MRRNNPAMPRLLACLTLLAAMSGCTSSPDKQHFLELVNGTVAPGQSSDRQLARAFGLDEYDRNDRAIALARATRDD
jgi:hypothetical protein